MLKATEGFDSIGRVDMTDGLGLRHKDHCCEFESHCAIEGSSLGRTDKMARCR